MYLSPFESFYILYYLYSSSLVISNLFIFTIVIVMFVYLLFFIIKFISCSQSFSVLKYYTKELYELTYNFINEQLPVEGRRYTLYMEYLFFIILFSNVLGFFPYSVALTSQICFIFIIALSSFLGMQYIALEIYKSTAFRFFFTTGYSYYFKYLYSKCRNNIIYI